MLNDVSDIGSRARPSASTTAQKGRPELPGHRLWLYIFGCSRLVFERVLGILHLQGQLRAANAASDSASLRWFPGCSYLFSFLHRWAVSPVETSLQPPGQGSQGIPRSCTASRSQLTLPCESSALAIFVVAAAAAVTPAVACLAECLALARGTEHRARCGSVAIHM